MSLGLSIELECSVRTYSQCLAFFPRRRRPYKKAGDLDQTLINIDSLSEKATRSGLFAIVLKIHERAR